MALFSGASTRIAASMPSAAGLAAPYIQYLARFGYAARGVVYLVVGIVALRTILSGGGPEDSSGALRTVLRQPFGQVLLAILAAGLVGWVLWRLFQALADPEARGTDAKGLATRAGYLISAAIHAGLTVEAVRLLLGASSGSGGGDRSAEHWTATALAQPFGRWLIVGVGLAIVLFGLFELYRAFRADFTRWLDLSRLGPVARRRVVLVGRLGMAARGVVFGLVGGFLLDAARRLDPQQAGGTEEALRTLQDAPYGPWLLGAVGAGLACYGLFELAEARYRVIRTS